MRRKDRPGERIRFTLSTQLRLMMLAVVVSFLIMVTILLGMLVAYNQEYINSLKNANTAAEFGNEFKQKLDADMIDHVFSAKSVDELPLEQVEQAEDVLRRMQEATTLSENQWRIRNMLKLCERLKESMIDTANIEKYNDRMQSLTDNVFQITKLIQDYMNNYIYDELKELSILQAEISERTATTIYITLCISVVLIAMILFFSLRFTNRITRPINQLCQKLKLLGDGDFTVSPVKTSYVEIKTLDDGFNEMVGRINELLDRVKEDQNALHRAELELLQAQINPHFLYNTFDSIIWLAETRRVDEAIKMVTNLSTFFRNSLSKGHDVITLEAEEKQVRSYLEIQQIRYNDILQYETDIPKSLLVYAIPKLTLQPLVENAIYHGIKNRRGMGKITIEGREEGDDIFISVHDNGYGMHPRQLETLRAGIYEDKHNGLGLVNVHKRLKLYCGEQYGLSFDSILGEGSTVTVRIPKQIQPTA